MSLVLARQRRWLRALRPGWNALASSSAPASRSGQRSAPKGVPLTVAEPESGTSRPRIMRMVVDLPEPFGPRKPVTTPGVTRKLRLSTATVLP